MLTVEKEEYMIAYSKGTDIQYLTTIYSTSISTTSDIDDANKIDSLDIAKNYLAICSHREPAKDFCILKRISAIVKVNFDENGDEIIN